MSSTPNFEVRPATARDVQTIANIEISAAQAAYQGLLSNQQISALGADKRQVYWREAI